MEMPGSLFFFLEQNSELKLLHTNLIGENGNHKLSGLERFNYTRYQIAIVGWSNVAFEAHVRKFWFGCYVDCHIASLKCALNWKEKICLVEYSVNKQVYNENNEQAKVFQNETQSVAVDLC